ncbi:hypothetical protein F4801DRAFT_582391 [Xylaria longipes]|nr:hypothetical protein F4801DRAFT_582391 [Xylaria longipes]RYC64761.1 hypothetical protein CHU98_g1450 [Xylaria longipes]
MRFLATVAATSSIIAAALAVPTGGAHVSRGAVNMTAPAHPSTNGTINSFADSCTTYGVHQLNHDAWLGAYCRAHDGSQPYSSLNLNLCIANNFGKMEAREDGDFAQTCNRMLIHGARPILYAFCDSGSYSEETVIDLGDFIDNDNGRLHCFGHYAT